MAGRTTLLVAHRRSTLHLADRIAVMEGGRVVETGTHDELMERSRLYRTLLSGLEEEDTEAIGDSIERWRCSITVIALASCRRRRRMASQASRTPAAGDRSAASMTLGSPSIGPGLGRGGGGGGGGWRRNLAPTPELLARVAALPPVKDFPAVDVERETRMTARFSLGRLLAEFRRPLLAGLVLVVIDGMFTLLGPVLVKDGHRPRGEHRLGDSAVRGFGDPAGRDRGRLRRRHCRVLHNRPHGAAGDDVASDTDLGAPPAPVPRLLRAGDGRTDYDPDDHRRRPVRVTDRKWLAVGAGVRRDVRRRGHRPRDHQHQAGAAHADAWPSPWPWRRSVPAPGRRLYDLSRERIAAVNADFQESLSGVRESQAFVHEDADHGRFHALGRDYMESRVAAQRLVALYFPFVSQFLAGCADAIILGVGAGLVISGR